MATSDKQPSVIAPTDLGSFVRDTEWGRNLIAGYDPAGFPSLHLLGLEEIGLAAAGAEYAARAEGNTKAVEVIERFMDSYSALLDKIVRANDRMRRELVEIGALKLEDVDPTATTVDDLESDQPTPFTVLRD